MMHTPQMSPKVLTSPERYRTLLEINNAIISNLTQESLLHAICEALQRVLPVYRAAISLYDRDSDTLRILALSTQWNSDYFRVGLEINRNDSHSGWVLDHQRPLLRRDVETEWQYPIERKLIDEGIKSYCAVPLILRGESIGTLNIGSDAKGQYSDEDAEFLHEVANQVALAIGNMKSYQEIAALNDKVEYTAQRYRTLLEINNAIITNLTPEDLLRSLSDILRQVVHFSGAALTLYNPDSKTFRYYALESAFQSDHFQVGIEFDRSQTISAWVFDNQRAVVRRDIEKEQQYPNDARLVAAGIFSDCIVPLVVGGKSIGTLNVGSTERNQYSDEDLETLQETANQVALAVANMLSYEEIVELKGR